MANEFNHLLPSSNTKIPSNIEVDTSPFSHLLPTEKKQKYKLSTEGNSSDSLIGKDLSEGDAFKHLLSNKEEKEDIDGDTELWDKVAFATKLGLLDTVRGVKQLVGSDLEQMKADQKKLYEYMENPDGSTNWAVAAAYFGSAILDPAGWLIPATKAKTLYKAAKWGFVSSGIAGGLGYVDEESILDTRAKQATAGAIGGTILSPVMKGVGKKLKGEKVFTRESLGIPGFDAPSIKVQADTELQKIKLQNEAGKKHRDAFARKKIEIDEPETLKDIPQDKTKLLQGPRNFFREFVVKPYEKNIGKPALRRISNGEFGAEAGGAVAGGVSGYATASQFEDAPTTTKLGVAFTGALAGALGLRKLKKMPKTTLVGEKGTDEAIEVAETWGDYIGRQFIDGYKLPTNYKGLKAEAQGFGNHIGLKFTYMANKIQKNLTEDEQKILINLLEGDTKLKVAPAKLKELSQESRKLINEMAQEYIDIGLITKETFERNKNIYIKRSYVGKTENRPFAEELKHRGAPAKGITLKEFDDVYKKQKAYSTTSTIRTEGEKKGIFTDVEGKKKLIKGHRGWELLESSKAKIQKVSDDFDKKIKGTRGKNKKAELIKEKRKALDELEVDARWEFTKPQRVAMGEIEDAAFAIAETGRAGTSTLTQYRFFDNLAKQPYVYDSKRLIPKELQDTYKQMPFMSMSKTDGKQRYGNLAGKYVPDEVYKNLISVSKQNRAASQGILKKYRTLNSYWKVSKTAWNPTVHVNNIVSNFVLHDLVDAEFKYLPKAWSALRKHNKINKATGKLQKSKLVEAATRYGVFDADLFSTELKNIQLASKFPYKIDEGSDVFTNGIGSSRAIYDDVAKKNPLVKLTEWYKLEDAVFRLSVFQDRLAKGWKIQDAALDARKSFVDYNIDAPAINFMRHSVTPFLAYTYRIIPILAETAIARPWKYFKYASIGYGLNEIGDLVSGGDEEAERAVMPERKQGHFLGAPFLPHRNIKFPVPKFGNEQESYYVDFTRFVPGGDVMDLQGTIPGLPAPLQPSLGVGGEIMFPLLGYDLFRQEKIKGQTGVASEDWKMRLGVLKDKLIPNIPFLPGSYSSKKLETTRKGIESPFKTEQMELLTLAQTLGFKIEKADIQKLKAGKVFELKRKIDGFKEQMNQYRTQYRNGLINKKTAQEKIEITANKIRALAEEYDIAFKKADYAEIKEPFEKVTNLFEKKN